MGPTRSAFKSKSIVVQNWLLFWEAITSKMFLLQERHPPIHLCTGAAGRSIKMGIDSFALREWCGSTAGNFPNLSGPAGALTIIMFLNCQLWKEVLGKTKGRDCDSVPLPSHHRSRGPQAHALHHLQAKAAVHGWLGVLKGVGGSGIISTKEILSHLPLSPHIFLTSPAYYPLFYTRLS